MSLIQEIRDGAIDDSVSLTTVLRRCLLLADQVGSEPLHKWAANELDGYGSGHDMPSYRIMRGILRGNGSSGPHELRGFEIPHVELIADLRQRIETIYMGQSVDQLQMLLEPDAKGLLETPLPEKVLMLINTELRDRMNFYSAWVAYPPGQVAKVLGAARTRVVQFSMQLERDFPKLVGQSIPVTPTARETVNERFNMTILATNSNVVVGDGMIIAPQTTYNVEIGNFDSLRDFLGRQGITDGDIEVLKELLEADPNAETVEDEKTGVGKWVAEQAEKAAGGVGDVAKGAVKQSMTTALIGAIKEYAPQTMEQIQGVAEGLGGMF